MTLAAVLGIIMEQLQGLGQLSSKSAMDVHGTWWRGCLRSMPGFTLLLSIDQFKESLVEVAVDWIINVFKKIKQDDCLNDEK